MGLPTKTLDQIQSRILGFFRTSFPRYPLGTKKFLRRTSRAVGLSWWGLHEELETLDRDIVPNPRSSSDALSEWAFVLGLPSGAGAGKYGRGVARTATGGSAILTGVAGTLYSSGTIAVAEDGVTAIKLVGSVTVPGTAPAHGSIVGQFSAVNAGEDSNAPIGSVFTWQAGPPGADASFVLTSGLSGGTNQEQNPGLYARIIDRLQNPPRGGVSEDYRLWAGSAGASSVFVYPRRSGTGSVDLVITVAGSGQNRRLGALGIQAAVQAAVDDARPVAVESANVIVPAMTDGRGLVLRVRVLPSRNKYNFDWDDTVGGPFTVDLYTPGAPATLRLNTVAPQSLMDAIDAAITAGSAQTTGPRLQVLSTQTTPIGSNAINPLIRVVAHDNNPTKTTLTLQTVLAGWTIPIMNDAVYAGGPVVDTIAAGELALVDSLGPSRISGFGDSLLSWKDRLTISGLVGVAEDAIDTDGTNLIAEVLAHGATINGMEVDAVGGDFTTDPPEMLFAAKIAITA